MKPIYIESERMKKGSPKKLLISLGVLIVVSLVLLLVAPIWIKSTINKAGADQKGYSFRVNDVDMYLSKGRIKIKDIVVFNPETSVKFAELPYLLVEFQLLDVLRKDKILSLKSEELNITLSKDLMDEVHKVKNDGKKNIKSSMYLKEASMQLDRLNVRELKNENIRTVLTLSDVDLKIKDIGSESINESSEFSMKSNIAEGGNIKLMGKTKLQANGTPWSINGVLSSIPAKVIEKLAGDKIPFDIVDAEINSKITAQSNQGVLEGILTPEIKEFKLSEDKSNGVLKRNVAKAINSVFKTKPGEDDFQIAIPFTLKENFSLNFSDTLEKIRKQK
jgi:hypothetical protein